jgi:hypothetical protein
LLVKVFKVFKVLLDPLLHRVYKAHKVLVVLS